MPNGGGPPFRLHSGRSPSPCHSSDSEETCKNKKEFGKLIVVRAVLHRLRASAIGLTSGPWHLDWTIMERVCSFLWNTETMGTQTCALAAATVNVVS